MLKSNSKKAVENIKVYIIERFEPCGYDFEGNESDFKEVATFIYKCFYNEMVKYDKRRMTEQALFFDWCSGLPSILDTCYYYNRSAVDDLAAILEESEVEKAKYTEEQAEERLTYLIYREIKKAVK